ncbi:MAG: CRISPR-associated endonuclease Cas2 [Clostridia bacterium]|nr:CRISPR-associated endonuclease Cas2 [Clostridia bacterium]
MIYRFMRILVFFDLPTETNADKTAYRQFRNFLIKEGFAMMQQSVYSKLALNGSTVELVKRRLQVNIPSKGLVQMLVITEKQFADTVYLVGESSSHVIDSTDKYILV